MFGRGRERENARSREEEQAAEDMNFTEAFNLRQSLAEKLARDGQETIRGKLGVYTKLDGHVYLFDIEDTPRVHVARKRTDQTVAQVSTANESRPWDHTWEEEAKLIDFGEQGKVINYQSLTDNNTAGGTVKPLDDPKIALPKARIFFEEIIAGETTTEPAGQ
jgi:hypothetical protein